MSDVTINAIVTQGGTIDADLSSATTIDTTVEQGGQIAAEVTGGGVGPPGPEGAPGTIVAVSSTAPVDPEIGDLWVDIS